MVSARTRKLDPVALALLLGFTTIVFEASGHALAFPRPNPASVASIELMLFGVEEIVGDARQDLRDEVEVILGEASVEVHWPPTDQPIEIAKRRVLLWATVRVKEPSYLWLRPNTMGVTNGEGGGHIYLFYPTILGILGIPPESALLKTHYGRTVLARAIARVLVHEVVHFVAPGREHAASGLMSHRWTKRMLTERVMGLDCATRRALLLGLEHLRLVAVKQ